MEFFFLSIKVLFFYTTIHVYTVNCFVKGTCQIIEVPMQGYAKINYN